MDTWGSGFGQGGSPVNREPRSNRQPASDSVVPGGGASRICVSGRVPGDSPGIRLWR